MSLMRNTFSGMLMTVAFLVLVAIAVVLYGGNDQQRAQMEQNFFWQKARLAFDTAFITAQALVNLGSPSTVNSTSNQGGDIFSQESDTNVETAGEAFDYIGSEKVPSFWSKLVADIKAEWQKGSETEPDYLNTTFSSDVNDGSIFGSDVSPDTDSNTGFGDFFDWRRTDTGTELIFKLKNDKEYKIALPFGSSGE